MKPLFRKTVLASLAVLAGLTLAPRDAEAQRRDRDLITREELVQSSQKSTDLYQAVRSLRAHFLQGPRGSRSLNVATPGAGQTSGSLLSREAPKVILYVNGSRSGDIDMMKNISTISVEEVRYLSPNAASMQFGPGHDGGAVLVKLLNAPGGGG